MSIAIKFENLFKEYRLGVIGHGTLYQDLQSWWAKVRGKEDPNSLLGSTNVDSSSDRIISLNNINLEVKEGEVLGIIGKNGAGKSTLLKILSRVTAPSKGIIKVKGRVASLLEVGTGFHPELTGRENIFLNGAINGMNKGEVKQKLDEIVDFAGIAKFLDTPVKRYSSGMHVRLGFSVAAHLDPDIMVVDEVLAVGDAEFQKRCIGKMDSVAKEGRTVLFVSHNMSMIESLCERAVLLDSGSLIHDSEPRDTITRYLSESSKVLEKIPLDKRTDRKGSGKVKTTGFRVLNENNEEVSSVRSGTNYRFEIEYVNTYQNKIDDVVASIAFWDNQNNVSLLFRTNFTGGNLTLNAHSGRLCCSIPNIPLTNGIYHISIFLSYADAEPLDVIEKAARVEVNGGDFFGTGSPGQPHICKVLTKHYWSSE